MLWRDLRVGVFALMLVACGGASRSPSVAKVSPRDTRPAPQLGKTLEAGDPVPLRRLTREEYNNSVRYLLGDTSRPADAFPPDEAVSGFESNSIAPVTSLLTERYMDAAEALAKAAAPHLDTLAPCATLRAPSQCASEFIDSFGRLAFRRPIDDTERSALLSVYAEKATRSGYAGGIQLVIETILQSPQFLYRVEPLDGARSTQRPLTGYEIATRLSFLVWASTPDKELLDDAAHGKLTETGDIERAVRRMLKDPRATTGLRSFHRQWLGLRELDTESKDTALAATFTPELKDAMVEETLRFSSKAVLDGGDAVKTLLTSNVSFVNAPLAKLYGVPGPSGGGFAEVTLPRDQRSGILTQASVMTLLSAADQTSVILRGKFVREKFLCQPIPPPPVNVVISAPKVDPKVTNKQRLMRHRTDPSCSSCHVLMDPVGFTFEHYDALGAWRTVDGAFPVDAVGELSMTDDADGKVDGVIELGARLSTSEQVRRCVATQWFRFALGRAEGEHDAPSLASAYRSFARAGFDVRELIVGIATSDAFRTVHFDAGASP